MLGSTVDGSSSDEADKARKMTWGYVPSSHREESPEVMELPTSKQKCPILPIATLLIISGIQSQRLTVRAANRAIG